MDIQRAGKGRRTGCTERSSRKRVGKDPEFWIAGALRRSGRGGWKRTVL